MSGSGWNRGTGATKPAPQKKPGVMRGAIAGLAVVAVLGVAAFFIFGGKDAKPKTEKVEKKPAKIAEVKPAVVRTNVAAAVDVVKTNQLETWLGKPVKEHRVRTNNTLVVETFITADGKTHKYYHDLKENALPSGADQILAIMTQKNGGFGAPPLPNMKNFENSFGDALKKEIVINDDDPDDVREVKERVKAARQELLDLMAQGKSANEVIREWQQMQDDNATLRREAALGVRELLAKGDRDGAKALCEKYNQVLEKAGIMKLEIPEENNPRRNNK